MERRGFLKGLLGMVGGVAAAGQVKVGPAEVVTPIVETVVPRQEVMGSISLGLFDTERYSENLGCSIANSRRMVDR